MCGHLPIALYTLCTVVLKFKTESTTIAHTNLISQSMSCGILLFITQHIFIHYNKLLMRYWSYLFTVQQTSRSALALHIDFKFWSISRLYNIFIRCITHFVIWCASAISQNIVEYLHLARHLWLTFSTIKRFWKQLQCSLKSIFTTLSLLKYKSWI